jgi:hypothetical protein
MSWWFLQTLVGIFFNGRQRKKILAGRLILKFNSTLYVTLKLFKFFFLLSVKKIEKFKSSVNDRSNKTLNVNTNNGYELWFSVRLHSGILDPTLVINGTMYYSQTCKTGLVEPLRWICVNSSVLFVGSDTITWYEPICFLCSY